MVMLEFDIDVAGIDNCYPQISHIQRFGQFKHAEERETTLRTFLGVIA